MLSNRNLLRSLAAEGRTVFVSSHLMNEMALTADRLIVIGRGRLLADASVSEVIAASSSNHVRVVTPDAGALVPLAAGAGLTLYELSPQTASLEEAFMEMTRDSADFHHADGGER